jgi:tetratricopeptide (TPR) repeat protein
MRIISADFNARTESGHLRLNSRGAQEDLRDQEIQVGDWLWLSDGELVVGAQLAVEDRYGIVGVPRWNTLVHLDDELGDFQAIREQFEELLLEPHPDMAYVTKLFQLSTILDLIEPPSEKGRGSRSYATHRAGALRWIDEPALALIDIKEAMNARPDDPNMIYYYLETLKLVDLDRAASEASDRAQRGDTPTLVLASCINAESMSAARLTNDEFQVAASRILSWINRFEFAPDRDSIPAPIRAQVYSNLGLTLLRQGRVDQAREAFGRAHEIDPDEPAIDEALGLDSFNDRARDIAVRLRKKPPLVDAA